MANMRPNVNAPPMPPMDKNRAGINGTRFAHPNILKKLSLLYFESEANRGTPTIKHAGIEKARAIPEWPKNTYIESRAVLFASYAVFRYLNFSLRESSITTVGIDN